MRIGFTRVSPPAVVMTFAGFEHRKIPTINQERKTLQSCPLQTPAQVGGPKITRTKTGRTCLAALPPGASSVASVGALLVLALAFISEPAAYAQGYTLAEALNATNLVWTADTTDDTSWFVQTAVTHDGVAAVECLPRIGAYGAKLHTTVTGPGSLTFWFRFGSGPPLGTELELVQQRQGGAAQRMLYGAGTDWTQGGTDMGAGVYHLQWGCVIRSAPEPVFLDQVQFNQSVRVIIDALGIAKDQVQVKFSAPANLASSFRLLNAAGPSGPWTINTAAVLDTNSAGDSFTFTAPLDASSAQFYRVQCSAGQ